MNQGSHVRDEENNLVREFDVVASKDFEVNGYNLRFLHVVECKWSKEKPWVILIYG